MRFWLACEKKKLIRGTFFGNSNGRRGAEGLRNRKRREERLELPIGPGPDLPAPLPRLRRASHHACRAPKWFPNQSGELTAGQLFRGSNDRLGATGVPTVQFHSAPAGAEAPVAFRLEYKLKNKKQKLR